MKYLIAVAGEPALLFVVDPDGLEPSTFRMWTERSNHWATDPKNLWHCAREPAELSDPFVPALQNKAAYFSLPEVPMVKQGTKRYNTQAN